MIFVDSSVWIDYFSGRPSFQSDWLDARLATERFCIGSLVLMEVLQGCRAEREFREIHSRLLDFEMRDFGEPRLAIESARNYRALRAKGITVRKTIDCLIATRCILDGLPLLYSDRDFDPFVEHLGLQSATAPAMGAN